MEVGRWTSLVQLGGGRGWMRDSFRDRKFGPHHADRQSAKTAGVGTAQVQATKFEVRNPNHRSDQASSFRHVSGDFADIETRYRTNVLTAGSVGQTRLPKDLGKKPDQKMREKEKRAAGGAGVRGLAKKKNKAWKPADGCLRSWIVSARCFR